MAAAAVTPDWIPDFISGEKVRATPEELEAVQVFSRRLVEELGYPKEVIQTRPQYRVRSSPGGDDRYPVDIAVFRSSERIYSGLFIVVECKRKNRSDGERQLKMYLSLSAAQIGVWFNGEEHLYLQKVLDSEGNVSFRVLPNIPRFGQRIEDIGRFRRADLTRPRNLKATFRDIRNHLVGMTTGITRDEALARELINLLFCKIYDEITTPLEDQVTFRAGVADSPIDVRRRMSTLFEQHVRPEYPDVFDRADTITLDPESVYYVVGELHNYCLIDADRDAIGEAFEVFIGPALRGSEGQFFTPRNVVEMVIDIVQPRPGEMIIDPACGSGGFLIVALERVWRALEEQGRERGWTPDLLARRKADAATRYFRGIDKDAFLARVTKAYMAIVGDGRGGVFCENSLKQPHEWDGLLSDRVTPETFDVVVTNPPFGSKIKVAGANLLRQYELGRVWKRDAKTKDWKPTNKLRDKQAPQVLFIERALQLLKPGGRLAIVLPESIFGNPSHGYIVKFLRDRTRITGIVSMPEELFQPHTHAKTCVVFLEKSPPKPASALFMGVAKWCGHDSRGNPIPYDDVPKIAEACRALAERPSENQGRFGFVRDLSTIEGGILIPKYYNPELDAELAQLSGTHELVTVQHLVDDGVIALQTGHEPGKLAYGTGPIPFIRTSDIANWELKIDPKHGISEQIYQEFANRQDVREHDVLVVRDGTYLVGTSCMLTKYDTKILYQSHIIRVRVMKPDRLSPFLLLAVLNSPVVKKQIRAKQFTQDIIDTLGQRFRELVLPLPKDVEVRQGIEARVRSVVETRADLRQEARALALAVASTDEPELEDRELPSRL